MKKFLVILVMVTLLGGFVFAQDTNTDSRSACM